VADHRHSTSAPISGTVIGREFLTSRPVTERALRQLEKLDAAGAVYSIPAEKPGWVFAEWFMPDCPTPDGSPWRWALQINDQYDRFERDVAQAILSRLNA
jgi:hypothetical protein